MKKAFLFLALLVPLLTSATVTSDYVEPSDEMLAYARMLNEFSERRRLNTFFINEQSPFEGVQVGYVNTTSGNLTFLRRDIVRLSRMPIVFGRVYDSRIDKNSDFGPGWKIAPMESMKWSEGNLIYEDASGSIYEFHRTDTVFELIAPFYSDFLHVAETASGVEVTYRNLWSRTFEAVGDDLRLSQVTDNNGNAIAFHYVDDGLSSIKNDFGKIAIERNANGLISAVEDEISRRVEYKYDEQDRLIEVIDMGGNSWKYEYDHLSRLIGIVDPNRNQALKTWFDPESRVSHADIRSDRYEFVYRKGLTEVHDINGAVSTYEYQSNGMTYRVTSPEGATTEIEFTPSSEVKILRVNGETRATMKYALDGSLAQLNRYGVADTTTIGYTYNWHENVVVAHSPVKTMRIEHDDNGNMVGRVVHNRHLERIEEAFYSYSRQGDLLSYANGNETLVFGHTESGMIAEVRLDGHEWLSLDYYPTGHLAKVNFPTGVQSTYDYSGVGFRTVEVRGEGVRREFSYDAAGNLTRIFAEANGRSIDAVYTLNGFNQLTQIHHEHRTEVAEKFTDLAIEYDGRGRPISFHSSDHAQSLSIRYDDLGRLKAIRQGARDLATYRYGEGQPDLRLLEDNRTAIVTDLAIRGNHIFNSLSGIAYSRPVGSLYGAVGFSDGISSLRLNHDWGLPSSDTLVQSALKRTKLAKDNDHLAFNRPSNSMFLPPEFASVNCCGPICDPGNPNCNPNDPCEPEPGGFCLGQVTAVYPNASSGFVVDSPTTFASSVSTTNPNINPFISYFWDFDDGNTATVKNTSHTFQSEGIFNVSLWASSVLVCDFPVPVISYLQVPIGCGSAGYNFHAGTHEMFYPEWETKVVVSSVSQETSVGGNFQINPLDPIGLDPIGLGFDIVDLRLVTPQELQFTFLNIADKWSDPVPRDLCGRDYTLEFSFGSNSNQIFTIQTTNRILIGTGAVLEIGSGSNPGNLIFLDEVVGFASPIPAHEFGHNLGFTHRPPGLHTDIMREFSSSSTGVHAYHTRVLSENY